MKIYSFRIDKYGFDFYLIDIQPGFIPKHMDPVPQGNHHRLNITLFGVFNFECPQVKFQAFNRTIVLFRPDIVPHSFECVERSFMLSFGFVI